MNNAHTEKGKLIHSMSVSREFFEQAIMVLRNLSAPFTPHEKKSFSQADLSKPFRVIVENDPNFRLMRFHYFAGEFEPIDFINEFEETQH